MTFSRTKDPAEVLDYSIDYSPVLQAVTPVDSISTSNWRIDAPVYDLVIDSDSHNGLIATVWLSGGTRLGARHKVVNTIVTTEGRTFERTIELKVLNK